MSEVLMSWTTTPAGAKTVTAGAGTKQSKNNSFLLGVTLLGLDRHQQQRLYQAVLSTDSAAAVAKLRDRHRKHHSLSSEAAAAAYMSHTLCNAAACLKH